MFLYNLFRFTAGAKPFRPLAPVFDRDIVRERTGPTPGERGSTVYIGLGTLILIIILVLLLT